MVRKLFVVFSLLLVLFSKSVSASSIRGMDELVADSTCMTVTCRFEKLLSIHPQLVEYKTIEKGNPIIRKSYNKTIPFLVSLFLLFLFSMARLAFPQYFENLFQIFSGFSLSRRHVKQQIENDNRASIWFYFIFFLSSGFLLAQIVSEFSVRSLPQNRYIAYGICLGIVLFLYLLRLSMLKILAWVFNMKVAVNQFLFTKKLTQEFLGLVLFPLSIIIFLNSGKIKIYMITLASSIYIVVFIYNYFRNIPLLRNLFRISFVHFLLYICSFEIIPILILIRLMK